MIFQTENKSVNNYFIIATSFEFPFHVHSIKGQFETLDVVDQFDGNYWYTVDPDHKLSRMAKLERFSVVPVPYSIIPNCRYAKATILII